MQQLTNPYTPNPGAQPKAVVGRHDKFAAFDLLLARVRDGMTERSLIITGLRGVGKTVLLGRFRDNALHDNCVVVELEVNGVTRDDFRREVACRARTALLEVSPRSRWDDSARHAAAVLRSFAQSIDPDGALTASFGVDAAEGHGDHNQLDRDLVDLFLAIGETARAHHRVIVILLDEIHLLNEEQMTALSEALYRAGQRGLPIVMAGAGLPQIRTLVLNARPYAERLFRFIPIGDLSPEDTALALTLPAADKDVQWSPDALERAYEITEGYPYFIQALGYAVWPVAPGPVIEAADVEEALPSYRARLDHTSFRSLLQRASPLQQAYLRAMAELGPEPQRAQAVASVMGRTSAQLGPVRAQLINLGLLYTPGHGFAAFTVPQFDQYVRRVIPELNVPEVHPRQSH